MTEQEIVELEQATGIALPAAYRRILLNYPSFPPGPVLDDGQPEELFGTKQHLWAVNADDPEYVREIFPAGYFVIGETGCGDFYAIDCSRPSAPVFMSGPHNWEYATAGKTTEEGRYVPTPVADSIEEFVQWLRVEVAQCNEIARDLHQPGRLASFVNDCFSWLWAAFMLLVMPIYFAFSFMLLGVLFVYVYVFKRPESK
jgi:hypothetical protein